MFSQGTAQRIDRDVYVLLIIRDNQFAARGRVTAAPSKGAQRRYSDKQSEGKRINRTIQKQEEIRMSKIKKLISALLVLVMAIAPCAALAEETIDSTVTILFLQFWIRIID